MSCPKDPMLESQYSGFTFNTLRTGVRYIRTLISA